VIPFIVAIAVTMEISIEGSYNDVDNDDSVLKKKINNGGDCHQHNCQSGGEVSSQPSSSVDCYHHPT
jgi:hypothetical protein